MAYFKILQEKLLPTIHNVLRHVENARPEENQGETRIV